MIPGIVLVALLLTVGYTARRGPRAGYLLVVVSCVWLLVNKPMEGITLVTFTNDHGFTVGDLVGLVGVGLGVRHAWPDLSHRSQRLWGRRRP